MRRRRVLTIGLAGLAAVLTGEVTGCGNRGSSHAGVRHPSVGNPPLPSPPYEPATYMPPKIDLEQLRQLYQYDQKAAPGTTVVGGRTENGVRVDDLTLTAAPGVIVPLYVVAQSSVRGNCPAVLFAQDAGATRDALLTEAVELAKAGAVCAVTGVGFKPTGDPQGDSALIVNAVTAQRRVLDLLGRRPEVDVNRMAMVGFGWGAAQAQIVAGLDTRLLGVVSVACGGRWSRSAFRSARPAGAVAYLDALTRFDGVRYLGSGTRRTVLFQFGRQDSSLVGTEVDEVVAATAVPRERVDYDAAHDLTSVQAAVADRRAFLHRVLRLRQALPSA